VQDEDKELIRRRRLSLFCLCLGQDILTLSNRNLNINKNSYKSKIGSDLLVLVVPYSGLGIVYCQDMSRSELKIRTL
jgi:hypothetical protein